MPNPLPLIPFGTVLGELTVLDECKERSHGHRQQWVVCTCGFICAYPISQLTQRRVRTCGTCKWQQKFPSEYNCWASMIKRCYDPTCEDYKNYGGRGITVCSNWRTSFVDFLSDVGPKPSPATSLNRRENDGNYEPNNCEWATATEQANNRRNRS